MQTLQRHAWLPYVAPIALFLGMSQIEERFGGGAYPYLYAVKIALVAGLLLAFRHAGCYPELRAEWRYLPAALALGAALCAAWVGVDRVTPHFAFLGQRAAYDPWRSIPGAAERGAFLAVRFAGLVAVAPLMEELLFRSFLLRAVIDPADFRAVPVGRYEAASCWSVVALMALAHPEWLAAAVFSLAMNLLVYRTRSVFACVAAHGATNLALGVYVVTAHAWRYW